MTNNNTPDKYIALAYKEMSASLLTAVAFHDREDEFKQNYDALFKLTAVTPGYSMEDANDALILLAEEMQGSRIALLIQSTIKYDY